MISRLSHQELTDRNRLIHAYDAIGIALEAMRNAPTDVDVRNALGVERARIRSKLVKVYGYTP